MKIQFAFALSSLVWGLGCAGRANDSTGSSSAGSGGSGTGSGGSSVSGGSVGGAAAGSTSTASCDPTAAEAGSTPESDAGVPLNHRASPCCSSQRGPGGAPQPYPPGTAARGDDGGIACLSDSQCVSGANGRCFPFEGLVGPGGCSYDECSSDSDCPSRTPCVCRNSPTDNEANVCAPGGNCAVDSDCGRGGYCSPSEDNCFGTNPYFCHTVLDTCVNDADCPDVDGASGATSTVCAYDQGARHWACSQITCLPP